MKLSFAITTHNEGTYVGDLLNVLVAVCEHYNRVDGHTYEIVVVDDYSTDSLTEQTLIAYEKAYPHLVRKYSHRLDGDFATHKNYLNSKCTGDWIFQLDADEMVDKGFLSLLPDIILSNLQVEAYWLPRVNTVHGLTHKHVQKWHWVLTKMDEFITVANLEQNSEEYQLLKDYNFILSEENGYVRFYQPIVQWPDMQMRLYKNREGIQWTRKVHEQLVGFEHFSHFPPQLEYAIRHHKDITRQEQQNTFYDTLT